jgi:hypothetical protein
MKCLTCPGAYVWTVFLYKVKKYIETKSKWCIKKTWTSLQSITTVTMSTRIQLLALKLRRLVTKCPKGGIRKLRYPRRYTTQFLSMAFDVGCKKVGGDLKRGDAQMGGVQRKATGLFLTLNLISCT